jgi:hypothetical protein
MCQSEFIESARTSTHVPCPAKHVSSSSYQRARINLFVDPAIRHQIDVLSAEWGLSLVETARRVLDRGLRGIMHADAGWVQSLTEKRGATNEY